tara:strand:- start:498 stop:737 length:240 start_codon:yes stop_codon:yes gene_type:complete
MSRTYVIINSDEVSSVNFDQVDETSESTIRYSLDGSKTFVKFDSDTTPSFLDGKTQYSHSEILTILATDEWTPDEPPGE